MNTKVALNWMGFALVLLLLANNINYDSIKRKKSLIQRHYLLANKFRKNKTYLPKINTINSDVDETFQQIKNSFQIKDFCSLIPKNLVGNFTLKNSPSEFNNAFSDHLPNSTDLNFAKYLSIGGSFTPLHCKPRHRIAIVIPYKNRLKNLNQFLINMHPFLQRQELGYTIFAVEQINEQLFNKGILMNAAYREIRKNYDNQFECILFHDVDLIPSDDLNLYSCSKRPRHMSILVGPHNYLISYPILVGGVLVFRFEHYEKVNGYSNVYWGWGAEDDDMYFRLQYSGVGFERPPRNSVYRTLDHEPRYKNPKRIELLQKSLNRYKQDGLNSVNYTLFALIKYPLITHIKIDVGIMPKELSKK